MSADADVPDAPAFDPADRDDVLHLLEEAIQEAHRKVDAGRVYDAENERVRQKWIRTLAYTANVYRQTLKDKELEQMRDRIDDLEARIDG
jgi:hypothetical protein